VGNLDGVSDVITDVKYSQRIDELKMKEIIMFMLTESQMFRFLNYGTVFIYVNE
jgi:hypothetical protein